MTENLIDPEAWEMMKSMADHDFMIELIDTYLSDSPGLIEQMRTGLSTGSIEVVRRAAHSLKSNSASFGANRLANASRDLEMLAKGGSLDGGGPMLALIEAEYTLIVPQLLERKNEC